MYPKIILTADQTWISSYNDIIFAGLTTCFPKGVISDRTRLGLMPFIEDVDAELEAIEDEGNVDLDDEEQNNQTGEESTEEEET